MAGKPHIQFYPGDWLRDAVSGCSLPAQGLWLRLMFIAHDSPVYGQIFATDLLDAKRAIIARRCGCTLAEFDELFTELMDAGVPGIDGGYYVSRRMMRDASLSEVRAKAGRKGGKQRAKQNPSKRQANSRSKRTANTDNDSDIDSDTDNDVDSDNAIAIDGFSRFWAVVPNKVGRAGAEKAYRSAVRILEMRSEPSPDGFLLDRMTLFAASPIGRGDKQFIPHPSTWLNNGRYDDDPATWVRRHDPRGTLSEAEKYMRSSNGDC